MKKGIFFILTLLIIACSKKENDLIVKATIVGLKKGTVYLKKMEDTLLITVDSLQIVGNSSFELQSNIESPELFFLDLDNKSNDKHRITFFADKGVTVINTTLKNVVFDAKIKGSKQQDLFQEYQTMISKMNNRNLDLIKEQFEAQKSSDTNKLNTIKKETDNSIKRKYLYTVNFALNNNDSEVAPYLALAEIYNANLKYLDTINNALTPKVKASKYGKALDKYIKSIRENN